MKAWPLRLGILLLAAVPAFSGLQPASWSQVLVPGATRGAVILALAAPAAIGLACGLRPLAGALAIGALTTLTVVGSGAAVAGVLHLLGWAYPGGAAELAPHYLALALNMLTVIPLAAAVVLTLPLERAETALLRAAGSGGVPRRRKALLMALRVFNHVAFFVIPEILEIVREERLLSPAAPPPGPRRRRLAADLVQLGVAGICGALQYLPLWAREIARLPEPPRRP